MSEPNRREPAWHKEQKIKSLAAQSLTSSYRILSVCHATERLGIDTVERLESQCEAMRRIEHELGLMGHNIKSVEMNLRELKKSKIRSLFEQICCCFCFFNSDENNNNKSQTDIAFTKTSDSDDGLLQSESSSTRSNVNNRLSRSMNALLKKRSRDTLNSSMSTVIDASKSEETFVRQRGKKRDRGKILTRQKTTSLVNLRARPPPPSSSSSSLASRSLKSLKSTLRLVKSNVSLLGSSASSSASVGEKNKSTSSQRLDSIDVMEKRLEENMRTLDQQLNNLQSMSRDIAKKIDAKSGSHSKLSNVNRFADASVQKVRHADETSRRILLNKKTITAAYLNKF